MTALKIEKTEFTPYIELDFDKNIFIFEGVSRPENVREFYLPAINWVTNLERDVVQSKSTKYQKAIDITFKFMYFNSSSLKMIFAFLESLHNLKSAGVNMNIVWMYEEEDDQMLDDGTELAEALGMKFKFVCY